MGVDSLQREEPAAEHPRGFTPEAQVPCFERVPRLHGDEAVMEIPFNAEPRRQPPLPDAGRQDRDGACSRTPLWLSAGRRVNAAAGPASAVLLSVPVLRSVVFTCLLPSTMAQLSIVNGKNGDVMPCRTLCSARFCGRGEWVSVVATSNEESPMKASVTQHPQLDTGGTPKLGL